MRTHPSSDFGPHPCCICCVLHRSLRKAYNMTHIDACANLTSQGTLRTTRSSESAREYIHHIHVERVHRDRCLRPSLRRPIHNQDFFVRLRLWWCQALTPCAGQRSRASLSERTTLCSVNGKGRVASLHNQMRVASQETTSNVATCAETYRLTSATRRLLT